MTDEVHALDVSRYNSVHNPADYSIDWAGFYRSADRRAAEVRSALPHHGHISYGAHPAQVLSVFAPPSAPGRIDPVFLFVHGGGFREGHPDHYDWLARPFVRSGIVFINVGYRLGGVVEALADVAAAIRWTWNGIGQYSGDPGRLWLGGHSAGAMVAASLAVRCDWQQGIGVPADVVRGAACVSGLYDFRARTAHLGISENTAAQIDPMTNIYRRSVSAIIGYGRREANRAAGDREAFARSGEHFARNLLAGHCVPSVVACDTRAHTDTIERLGDPASELFRSVAQLMMWGDADSN